MSKSVIYFQSEKVWTENDNFNSFCAPFSLSENDESVRTDELRARMIKALAAKGYQLEFIQWHTRRVLYRKPQP